MVKLEGGYGAAFNLWSACAKCIQSLDFGTKTMKLLDWIDPRNGLRQSILAKDPIRAVANIERLGLEKSAIVFLEMIKLFGSESLNILIDADPTSLLPQSLLIGFLGHRDSQVRRTASDAIVQLRSGLEFVHGMPAKQRDKYFQQISSNASEQFKRTISEFRSR